ncbi:MAG: tetratricopeptide repeat protein [Rhodospirillales bacterium]
MKLIIFALLLSLVAAAFAANLFLGDLAEDDAMRAERLFEERVAGYENAASAGNARAQLELGLVYLDGPDGLKDPKKSFRLFKQSSQQGNAEAFFQLGRLYELGLGTETSFSEAARAYATAIRLTGHRRALLALGMMHFQGQGVVHSEVKAAEYFRQAAEQGEPAAQFLMGRIYESGFGVPRDPIEAYKWYALSGRDADAVRAFNSRFNPDQALADLAATMNKSQVDAAKNAIERWRQTRG